MPMTRQLLADSAEFETWAQERFEETGEEGDTWQNWFKDDMPKSYPAIVVFFWMERAGLIVDAWLEYVYPQDFPLEKR